MGEVALACKRIRAAGPAAILAYFESRRGATAMEYGLIGVGIALTITASLFLLGDELIALFNDIAAALGVNR